jgi:hypothetical protein
MFGLVKRPAIVCASVNCLHLQVEEKLVCGTALAKFKKKKNSDLLKQFLAEAGEKLFLLFG